MKVNITYVNGSGTTSTLSESSYQRLMAWFLNPKANRFYRLPAGSDLLINKQHIAYILASKQ